MIFEGLFLVVMLILFVAVMVCLLKGATVETVEDQPDFQTSHEALRLSTDVEPNAFDHSMDARSYTLHLQPTPISDSDLKAIQDIVRHHMKKMFDQSFFDGFPTKYFNEDLEAIDGLPPLFADWWQEEASKLDEGND